MKLSPHFSLEELTRSTTAQRLKINNIPDEVSLTNLRTLCEKILQPIRNKFRAPLIITSGYRSLRLNKAVGSSNSSQHLFGQAADFVSNDNKRLWSLILEMIEKKEIRVGQLINEKNLSWIHISLPTEKHINEILKL